MGTNRLRISVAAVSLISLENGAKLWQHDIKGTVMSGKISTLLFPVSLGL